MKRLRVLSSVVRDPSLLRIEVAYLGFSMAENGTWVAILVYAYSRGGAVAAGLVATIQLIPAAIIAPVAAYAGDRFRRDRVLVIGYLLQAAAMGATAGALFADAPVWIVYTAATAAAVAVTITRPAQNALLPSVTSTVEHLTAANATSGVVEGAGIFAGPFIAGIILSISEPGTVFAAFAASSLVSAALVARLRVTDGGAMPRTRMPLGDVVRQTLGGFSVLRRERDVRLIVLILSTGIIVVGALDVLYVAAAIDLLDLGQGGAGFLTSAFGIGGIFGAAASVLLVGRRRLTPSMAAGSLTLGTPLVTLGVLPSATAAPALIAAAGAGRSVADVAGRTLLQRIAPDVVLARVFGALEGLSMISLAIGSAAASVLIEALGVDAALIVTGVVLPATLVLAWRRLLSIDREAAVPDEEVVSLLRGLPLFAPLPAPVIERLVANLVPLAVEPGTAFIVQGDAGDRFYLILDGEADVTVDGNPVSVQSAGDYVGEIALLRDSPRTATVTARTPMRLLALEREPFLQAVTGHPQSREAADAVVRDRLGSIGRDPRAR
jgi:MFS family permease